MSYTVINFKTKKAVKEAVAKWNANPSKLSIVNTNGSMPVTCYNPGLGPNLSNHTGKVYLEGPHYPEAHKWYAQGEMIDGVLVKVS